MLVMLGRSFPENTSRVFASQFVSDAFIGEADELGKRSARLKMASAVSLTSEPLARMSVV
jgi:hypothetical protein